MNNTLKNLLRLLNYKHREIDSPEETKKRLLDLMGKVNPDFNKDKGKK